MKITKKNGNIALYDDEKVKKSILSANTQLAEETISSRTAETLSNEVFDRLSRGDAIITTAEVRACVYELLQERGFPLTAARYWEYKKA